MAAPTQSPPERPPAAHPGWRVALCGVALVAAAALGVTTGTALLDHGPDPTLEPASAPQHSSPAPTRPAASSPAAPVVTQNPDPSVVPVYVVAGTGQTARLYREFRTVARPGQSAARSGDRAVQLALGLLAGPAQDPDYRTLWTGMRVTGLHRSGADLRISLAAAPPADGTPMLRLAVQQLVYTVTAADPTLRRVRLDGSDVRPELSAPTGRGAQSDVLAPVWLLSPTDGATVPRRVKLNGTASVYEGTVNIEVRRGPTVVVQTSTRATLGAPGRGDWAAAVTLPGPGDYEIRAFESSPKDGSAQYIDTKWVTAR